VVRFDEKKDVRLVCGGEVVGVNDEAVKATGFEVNKM
jgi:hypothetical protein